MITTSHDLGINITTIQVVSCGGAPCSRQLALQMKETFNTGKLSVGTSINYAFKLSDIPLKIVYLKHF
jgi:hypothetical protein